MGLMKAEKKEVVYITMSLSGENFSIDYSYSELKNMMDNNILPVLFFNFGDGIMYFYPQNNVSYNMIVFTNTQYMDAAGGMITSVTVSNDGLSIVEGHICNNFYAVFSQTGSTYTCNKTVNDFMSYIGNNFIIPHITFKLSETVSIPLTFGGINHHNDVYELLYYYNDYHEMKRKMFSYKNNIVTMTETSIS